jgi:acetyl/propionyl-CoA carboxylase alpha subunit
MKRALAEFEIDGVPTTAKFHEAVLRHPTFLEGSHNTGFLEKEAAYFKDAFSLNDRDLNARAALLAAVLASEDQARGSAGSSAQTSGKTSEATGSLWRARGRVSAITKGGL